MKWNVVENEFLFLLLKERTTLQQRRDIKNVNFCHGLHCCELFFWTHCMKKELEGAVPLGRHYSNKGDRGGERRGGDRWQEILWISQRQFRQRNLPLSRDCDSLFFFSLKPWAVVWLTQFAKQLHSQGCVDEEEQHEEETEVSHLERKSLRQHRRHQTSVRVCVFIWQKETWWSSALSVWNPCMDVKLVYWEVWTTSEMQQKGKLFFKLSKTQELQSTLELTSWYYFYMKDSKILSLGKRTFIYHTFLEDFCSIRDFIHALLAELFVL